MSLVGSSLRAQPSASLLALTSSVLFAAMALVTKVLASSLSGPQIAMVRFAVGIAALRP